jgi:hypothetical protein
LENGEIMKAPDEGQLNEKHSEGTSVEEHMMSVLQAFSLGMIAVVSE